MVGKDKIIELLTQQFGDRVDAPTKDYLGDVVIDSAAQVQNLDDFKELVGPFIEASDASDADKAMDSLYDQFSALKVFGDGRAKASSSGRGGDDGPAKLPTPLHLSIDHLAGAGGAAPAHSATIDSESGEVSAPSSPHGSPRSRRKLRSPRNAKKTSKLVGPGSSAAAPTLPLVVSTAQQSRFWTEMSESFGGTLDLDLKDVSIEIAGKLILNNANLKLKAERRYGLIGRNGVGKSTILRQMASQAIPGWPRNSLRVLLVEQESVGDARDAIDTVMESDVHLAALWAQARVLREATLSPSHAKVVVLEYKAFLALKVYEEATAWATKLSGQRGHTARQEQIRTEKEELDARTLAQEVRREFEEGKRWDANECSASEREAAEYVAAVQEKLNVLGANEAKARATKILRGMGFSESLAREPTVSLSGGWRMRCALASALFAEPRLLLMDEPSNHLDLKALLWLTRYLVEELTDTTVVVVSHDRSFLNDVCTDIIWLRHGQLTYHEGNYEYFETQQEESQLHKARLAESVAKQRAKLKEQIANWERDARKSGNDKALKQAASRRKKLEDRTGMQKNEKGFYFKRNRDMAGYNLTSRREVVQEVVDPEIKLKLPCAEPLGYYGPVLQLDNVSCGWDKSRPPIVSNVTLEFDTTSRVALVGANGEGKSTLMATIVGAILPLKGKVTVHPRLRVAYFSQHHAADLPADQGAVPYIHAKFPHMKEQEIRSHLGGFGITGKLALQPMQTLSGGQKTRVVLADIMMKPPHVLMLDEPSNHLDLDTIAALTQALSDFDGGVILVSHDRQLVAEVASEIYLVANQTITPVDDIEDYVDILLGQM